MTKKAGKKKRVIITVTTALVVLLALSELFVVPYHNYTKARHQSKEDHSPFAMMYHNDTKEICVMEPVDRMLLRQGVGRDKILLEIGYSVIKNGEVVENYLFVFENGDVYSGYNIDSYYANNYPKEEQWRHLLYFYFSDDRLWDALCEQCYWGSLSSRDLDGIVNELAQVDFVYRDFNLDYWMESQIEIRTENPIVIPIGTQSGTEIGIQTEMPMKSSAEWTYDQENNDIYVGHGYLGRMECDGIKSLEWISGGSAENVERYYHDEHAHNAIDIIKSTWAYGQWTNQIFGEGWEERIDLKDELEEDSF